MPIVPARITMNILYMYEEKEFHMFAVKSFANSDVSLSFPYIRFILLSRQSKREKVIDILKPSSYCVFQLWVKCIYIFVFFRSQPLSHSFEAPYIISIKPFVRSGCIAPIPLHAKLNDVSYLIPITFLPIAGAITIINRENSTKVEGCCPYKWSS